MGETRVLARVPAEAWLMWLLVLVVGMVLLAPGAAGAVPASTLETTTLTLASSDATPSYNTTVTLSATLDTTAKGKPGLALQTLALERKSSATEWSLVATSATDAKGAATWLVKPYRYSKTIYRARFAVTSVYAASTSAEVTVTPKVYLTKPNAPTTMYKGRARTIAGRLKPRHTAGTYPVRIYKYRYVSGKWKGYGYVKAKAVDYSSYSKYTRAFSLPYRGKWRLRAVAPADSKHAKTYSTYDYVTVK